MFQGFSLIFLSQTPAASCRSTFHRWHLDGPALMNEKYSIPASPSFSGKVVP
jgi:hypothetical protein